MDTDVTPGVTYAYELLAVYPTGEKEIVGPIAVTAIGPIPGITRLLVTPNPSRGQVAFALEASAPEFAATGPITLRILGAGGRIVRELRLARGADGGFIGRWDGRDGANREVAGGTYFLRVEPNGERSALATARVTIVR